MTAASGVMYSQPIPVHNLFFFLTEIYSLKNSPVNVRPLIFVLSCMCEEQSAYMMVADKKEEIDIFPGVK